jgi:ribose 5-phosphate isomerase B
VGQSERGFSAGASYKNQIKQDLEKDERVASVIDVGVPDDQDDKAYPHVAVDAARKVAAGEADRALLMQALLVAAACPFHSLTDVVPDSVRSTFLAFACFLMTTVGVAIAANKVAGIRAVTAHDSYSVERSVMSNNAQVLCMGQRVVGLELARRLAKEWLGCKPSRRCP